MTETFGRRVKGKIVKIPTVMLTNSVAEKVYEVHIKTLGIPSAVDAVMLLQEKLYEEHRVNVVWGEVEGNILKMQVISSPLPLVGIVPFIPAILGILGITVALVSVYAVLTTIPNWVWGMLAVGLGLIFIGPKVGKIFVQE